MHRLITALSFSVLTALTPLSAQGCGYNAHPITFVNSAGQPLPTFVENGETFAQSAGHDVYMALPPTFPSGIYVVQVTDSAITEILSRDPLVDRTIVVTNVGGVIQMSRLSVTPGLRPFGAGLNGAGQSMPMAPLSSPTSTSEPCRFKAWITDYYVNPDNDPMGYVFGARVGINPQTQVCAVSSYAKFRIGNGTPAAVTGLVFLDSDLDGVRDDGEPGVPGASVRLTSIGYDNTVSTDAQGMYLFANVPTGDFTVQLVGSGFQATTPTSHPVPVCGCVSARAPDFGIAPSIMQCNARTPGFWGGPNGLRIIQARGLLADLGALQVVTATGARFTTTSLTAFQSWLQGSEATNMAYKLSSHVVAMHFNLRAGLIDQHCTVRDPQLGVLPVTELLSRAVTSLNLYPLTPVGHPQRANQELLKDALDRANNNQTWY